MWMSPQFSSLPSFSTIPLKIHKIKIAVDQCGDAFHMAGGFIRPDQGGTPSPDTPATQPKKPKEATNSPVPQARKTAWGFFLSQAKLILIKVPIDAL